MAYDIAVFVPGKPAVGECILKNKLERKVIIPPNFSGSLAFSSVNPTADAVFTVKSGGATIGTITLRPGSSSARVTAGNLEVVLDEDDDISIYAPSPQDATMQGLTITLVGVA